MSSRHAFVPPRHAEFARGLLDADMSHEMLRIRADVWPLKARTLPNQEKMECERAKRLSGILTITVICFY